MKYIIEYLGGCRGDFLCNFLNYGNLILEDEKTSKSKGFNKNFKSYTSGLLKYKTDFNYEKFEIMLQEVSEKYTPSHQMFYFQDEHYNLLKKYNFTIYKIIFSEKWYNNILIELLFKNPTHVDLSELITAENYLNNFFYKKKFFFDFYNHPKNNENKILLDYEKLFFDIEIEKFFNEIDLKKYKEYLKRVELKKKIELWGKKYYPQDYGYVWNENL
jgi:hypothetical protein